MIVLKKVSTLLLILFFITSAAVAGTGNNLYACVSGACPDEPMSIMELATQKAGELIDSFYRKRHKYDGFNGSVMIAKDGKPIYNGSFGYGNYLTKDTITNQSTFQLASVSKTFTSTAILMLVERGQLSLDDSVQQFFPNFPYHGITVRLLLSHRTGLPDYINLPKEYFPKECEYASNTQLMEVLAAKRPPVRCRPDRMFIYCNTNYAVLASIVESVSGVSFRKFMHDNVFSPLGMQNTYVYDPANATSCCETVSYEARWREWKNNLWDGVSGDKGIFSSTEDMLKWDNALRSNLLLTAETMEEAYKPRSLDRYSFVKEKEKNYGYGWRMNKRPDNSYLIYHNGFWHGSNNVFARDLSNGYTVIVLGNKANPNNYQTFPVWDVLNQLKTFDSLADVP